MWFTDDRTTHRNTLALTTGERLRLSLEIRLEIQEFGGVLDATIAFFFRDACDLEGEAHVLGHRHVRIERIGLEDHRDIAILRCDIGDITIADEDRAVVDLLESCQHAK